MSSLAGPLAALCASLTWVVGSSVYSHLSRRFSGPTINFNRALVALPLFLLATALQREAVEASVASLGPALGVRALWLSLSILSSYAFGDILFMWGALSIGFPAAQAIGASYPVWAALAGWIVLGEPVSASRALGMALAIAGTVAVVVGGAKAERTKPPAELAFLERYSVGVAAAFAASLAWAVNCFATGRGGQGMNPAFANAMRMMIALGALPFIARLQQRGSREGMRLLLDKADYKRFLPFFAVEAFGGSYLYLYGLSHSTVAVGSTLSSLAPVASVPVAVALGWERFSWRSALAIVVVVVGVVLLVA